MQHRVLLIHGSDEVRELTARAMARVGVPLDIADGPDAVESFDHWVVVLDHALAGDAIARISAQPRKPVVIVTAAAREAEKLDPEKVSLVIPSPFEPAMLVGVVLACVAGPGGSPAGAPITLSPPERGEGSEVC